MTDFQQALTWLNQFDRSHLSLQTEPRLKKVKDPRLSEADREKLMINAQTAGRTASDPLEYPELLVYLAEDQYTRKRFEKAQKYLLDAIQAYTTLSGSEHRTAVTEWLLGIVEWEMKRNLSACNHWRTAREGFTQLVLTNVRLGLKDREEWYRQYAYEMSVALGCTPEEGMIWYSFLIRFDKNSLGEGLKQLRKKLGKAVAALDYLQVNQTIDRMLGVVKSQGNTFEKAEVYLECGLARYHLLESKEAIRFIEQAIPMYLPGSHRQAVVRWILGAIQWQDKALADEAIRNWSRSLDDFSTLIDQANWDKAIYQLNWYRDKKKVMKSALNQKISG
jgi:tetratricopeptide (TPR) repeat protein